MSTKLALTVLTCGAAEAVAACTVAAPDDPEEAAAGVAAGLVAGADWLLVPEEVGAAGLPLATLPGRDPGCAAGCR